MSPRLSEAAVIKRQILEGVLAIVKLNGAAVAKSRISLQVFDRRGGTGNVKFEGSFQHLDCSPYFVANAV